MGEDKNKALLEAAKELGRLALFAAASAVVASLLEKLAGLPQDYVILAGTAILRAVDKWLHEWGKEQPAKKGEENWAVGGLSRF